MAKVSDFFSERCLKLRKVYFLAQCRQSAKQLYTPKIAKLETSHQPCK